MNTFYITTPIFYPTGLPHIGTSYTVFIADTLARYYSNKIGSENVQFLTGTDEHGGNIAKKAEELNQTPQEYVDNYAKKYQDIWKGLNISNNYFIRTTNTEHEQFAKDLIQKSFDNGDIYEGEYSGWYCESCESYYTEEDLIDGKCPNHPTKLPIFTKEKNYYFKLSKYADWLLTYIEENPEFITPVKWREYVKSLIKEGLKDIPVTRANVKWGIEVPFDKSQTIYVWYDALPNYLSYLNFKDNLDKDYYNKFWKNSVHVVGKDIIKFHAILWPAMLKSAGYPIFKNLLVHGFFTVDGLKIGKSNNNAIDPLELGLKYTNDAVRYTLLSEFQIGNDGDFSYTRLEEKYNNELGNNFGNLLNRVIHLANQKSVNLWEDITTDSEVKAFIDQTESGYSRNIESFKIFEAIQLINELCSFGNKYINDKKPWELDKATEIKNILINLRILLEKVIQLYSPIIPDSSDKALKALKNQEKIILFPKIQ